LNSHYKKNKCVCATFFPFKLGPQQSSYCCISTKIENLWNLAVRPSSNTCIYGTD